MLYRLSGERTPRIYFLTLITAAAISLSLPGWAFCVEAADSEGIDWESQIAYQRGIEAMNWALPAVSMLCMRNGNFSLGGGFNTVYWLSEAPTAL